MIQEHPSSEEGRDRRQQQQQRRQSAAATATDTAGGHGRRRPQLLPATVDVLSDGTPSLSPRHPPTDEKTIDIDQDQDQDQPLAEGGAAVADEAAETAVSTALPGLRGRSTPGTTATAGPIAAAAFSSDAVPPIVLEAHPLLPLSPSAGILPSRTSASASSSSISSTGHRGGGAPAADSRLRGDEGRAQAIIHHPHLRLPTDADADADWPRWLVSLILSLFSTAEAVAVLPRLLAANPQQLAARLLAMAAAIPRAAAGASSRSRTCQDPCRRLLLQQEQPPPPPVPELRLGRSVSGLTNYGQTCFLNSVLQAVASVPAFEVYLHRVVAVQQLRSRLVEGDIQGRSSESHGLCQDLLELLWTINGGCCAGIHRSAGQWEFRGGWAPALRQPPGGRKSSTEAGRRADPRRLLQRVGARHRQFASKAAGGTSASASASAPAPATREQQDAQEFWQALLGMVVEDADVQRFSSAVPTILSDVGDPNIESSQPDQEHDVTIAAALRHRGGGVVGRSPCGVPDHQVSHSSPQHSSSPSTSPTGFHEEKKLEEGSVGAELESNSDSGDACAIRENQTLKVGSTCDSLPAVHVHASASQPAAANVRRRMEDDISSISPSPFSGWVGSVLQCRTCRHVRPIRNHLFVDLPVVPTGVSSYLHRRAQDPWLGHPSSVSKHRPADPGPPCTLEQCLEDYTSVERVHDVECRSCTRAKEMALLADEVNMLERGIEALEMKLRKNQKSRRSEYAEEKSDLAKPLRDELQVVRARLEALRLTSPDDEGAMERVLSPEQEHLEDCHIANSRVSKIQLQRTDAFKCLLLTRLPAILCIHVQRRFYDPLTLRASKTAQHVIFPEILDAGPYCVYAGPSVATGDSAATRSSRIPYRLMSVIEHTGGAFYGHYVSYRRDPASPAGSQWLYISDDTVRRVDWNVVRRCQAYMLFYEAFV